PAPAPPPPRIGGVAGPEAACSRRDNGVSRCEALEVQDRGSVATHEWMEDPDHATTRWLRRTRWIWHGIPSSPRCKMCYRPFGLPGGPILRMMGLRPWTGNPKY